MNCKVSIIPRLLHFKQPAGTSHRMYTTRKMWYPHLTSPDYPGRTGVGECTPLSALNCDDLLGYEDILVEACRRLEDYRGDLGVKSLRNYPSISLGLETAVRHFRIESWALYDTAFSHGGAEVPIDGLIWMRDFDRMLTRIEEKMAAGLCRIRLKIGTIDFDEELALLRHIRAYFSSEGIELRVDANGAFSPVDVMKKLKRLSELGLHSTEQPIRAGQWEEMARLVSDSPLPIALGEELIGCNTPEGKRRLLSAVSPQYIVFRPSPHGGICGRNEWIAEVEKRHIGQQITSALESSIGLSAVVQWCATFGNPLPQELGTGQLFTGNVEMSLEVRKDCLWFRNDDI